MRGASFLEEQFHLLPVLLPDLGAWVVAWAVGNHHLGRLLAVPAARNT